MNTPIYNHAFALAFSLATSDPTGELAHPTRLRHAILERLASLDDDELLQAVGMPYDTYPVGKDP